MYYVSTYCRWGRGSLALCMHYFVSQQECIPNLFRQLRKVILVLIKTRASCTTGAKGIKFLQEIASFRQRAIDNKYLMQQVSKDLVHLVKLPSVKNIHPCKWSIWCQLYPEIVYGIHRQYLKLKYKNKALICHFQDFQWMVISLTTLIKCKIWMQSGMLTLIKV